jgi:hypothetical protein
MRAFLLGVAATLALVLSPPAAAWSWPVDGPVLRPFVFGGDPYLAGQHRGIDIGAAGGASVGAPSGGVVSFAGSVPGAGSAVTIRTGQGYSVTLVHLGSIGVIRGAVVDEGAAVGTVGPSGDAEWPEPYLHLGVRVTAEPEGYVDPLGLLPRRPAPVPPPAEERPGEGPLSSSGGAEEGQTEGDAVGPDETAERSGSEESADRTDTDEAADDAAADGQGESSIEEAPAAEGNEGEAADGEGAPEVAEPEGATGAESAPERTDAAPDGVGEADAASGTDESSATDGGTQAGADETASDESARADGAAPADADAAQASPAVDGPEAAPTSDRSLPTDDPPVVDDGVPAAETPASAEAATASGDAPVTAPPASATPAPDATASDAGQAPAGDGPGAEAVPAPELVGDLGSVVAEPADAALESRGRFVNGPVDLPGAAMFFATEAAISAVTAASREQARASERNRTRARASSRPDAVEAAAEGNRTARDARAEREPAASWSRRAGPTSTDVRGDVPAARPPVAVAEDRPHRSRWLAALVALVAGAAALACWNRARGARPAPKASTGARIISVVGAREPAEDPGRSGLAVRERAEAHRPCRGVRGAVGHLRPLPPVEGGRRPDGQWDGRARDAGDGRCGQRGRLAA